MATDCVLVPTVASQDSSNGPSVTQPNRPAVNHPASSVDDQATTGSNSSPTTVPACQDRPSGNQGETVHPHGHKIIIAIGGIIITLGTFIVTVYFAYKNLQFTSWEAGNEFWDRCREYQHRNTSLSNQCIETLDRPRPAPPPIARRESRSYMTFDVYWHLITYLPTTILCIIGGLYFSRPWRSPFPPLISMARNEVSSTSATATLCKTCRQSLRAGESKKIPSFVTEQAGKDSESRHPGVSSANSTSKVKAILAHRASFARKRKLECWMKLRMCLVMIKKEMKQDNATKDKISILLSGTRKVAFKHKGWHKFKRTLRIKLIKLDGRLEILRKTRASLLDKCASVKENLKMDLVSQPFIDPPYDAFFSIFERCLRMELPIASKSYSNRLARDNSSPWKDYSLGLSIQTLENIALDEAARANAALQTEAVKIMADALEHSIIGGIMTRTDQTISVMEAEAVKSMADALEHSIIGGIMTRTDQTISVIEAEVRKLGDIQDM